MSVPTVGVAMVTFNHERFVREAVESILGEGHPSDRLQLVIVDNGSTDSTPDILREYADRAEIHCIEPLTVNQAANLGLARLSTDYFTVFSGDDVWKPGRLAHMLEIMERRPEVGLLCGDKEIIDGDGNLLAPSAASASGIGLPAGPPLGRLMEGNVVFGPTMLMRGTFKPALTPIPPEAAWEDWWFAATAARISQLAYTPAVLAGYRRHGNNITAATSPEKQAHLLREELRFRGWLLQTVAAGEVTAEELVNATLKQVDFALGLAKLERRTPERVAGITGAARRQAQAANRRAQAGSDPLERLIHLAHAVGHDPTEPRYGRALSKAANVVDEADLDVVLGHVTPAALIEDARDRVTLALADELVAEPELLDAYSRVVGPEDSATLAVYAPDADPAATAEALTAAFEAAGVPDEAVPDVVLLPLPATAAVRAGLAVRADDLLTSGAASGWPYDGMARFAVARQSVATT